MIFLYCVWFTTPKSTKKPTRECIKTEFSVKFIRFIMCLQEMLGLMKPATSGQQGKPLAPHDAAASCRCEMIVIILLCEIRPPQHARKWCKWRQLCSFSIFFAPVLDFCSLFKQSIWTWPTFLGSCKETHGLFLRGRDLCVPRASPFPLLLDYWRYSQHIIRLKSSSCMAQ